MGEGGLIALLPCKPDRATREVLLAGEPVAVQMAGCEAGGAMFTVAQTVARDAAQASDWQAAWKAAMTAKLHATAPTEVRVELRGAATVPVPLRLSATGIDGAGQPISTQIFWFAQAAKTGGGGPVTLYQAVVLGQPREAQATGAFFDGLRLP